MTHKTLGTSFLVLGALIVTIGSQMSLGASITERGSYLGASQTGPPMFINQELVLPAASMQSSNPAGVLAFGMLMMLIGFGMHALWTIRKNDEQPVAVNVRKKRAPKKEPRTSRTQMEVIWVERTIRF